MLGSADLQSRADLGNSVAILRGMPLDDLLKKLPGIIFQRSPTAGAARRR